MSSANGAELLDLRMKTLSFEESRSKGVRTAVIAAAMVACMGSGMSGACDQRAKSVSVAAPPPAKALGSYVIDAPPSVPRPPFQFSKDDDAFLDEVQRGAFNYFWDAANPKSQMIPDRTSNTILSMAGVGFQLCSLCIGVERKWVSREDAQKRAEFVLRALASRTDIRKHGLFYHFLEGDTAGQPDPDTKPPEIIVSTIDTALLMCGIMTASSYFGGEVAKVGDALVADANWKAFVLEEGAGEARSEGFVSLGWKPDDPKKPTGEGKLLPYAWIDCGDEHRLVTFLGVAAPREEHRLPPETYYRMRRQVGQYGGEPKLNAAGEMVGGTGPVCYFPWSGALFVSTFAHCWLDYSAMGPDDPHAFGFKARPRVDWWENARRTTRLHQIKCAENPMKLPTLSAQCWGLTASDKQDGYLVAGVFPDAIPVSGAIPEHDYPMYVPKDAWGDGTIAPYAAGSTVMFSPGPAVAALRHYAGLKNEKGEPLVWRSPSGTGASTPRGHGFRDAFNLKQPGESPWAAPDDLAIDQGPLLVAIENARTGLVWRLFAQHPVAKAGMERLRMKINR